MEMHFINHLGRRGVNYLHPGGKNSSDFLIDEILKRNPSSVLELGCGIGATLVSLASNDIKSLVGIDISSSQIARARRLVKHCQIEDKIELHELDMANGSHFANNSFDIVFAESVLGILSHDSLVSTMVEIKRILKPDGLFISNDAIWKANSNNDLIYKVNRRALKDFGLIQSSSTLIGKAQWEQFFYTLGFKSCRIIEIKDLPNKENAALNAVELMTKDYKLKVKFYSWFNLNLLYQDLVYKLKLKLFHRHDGKNLENYLFILQA
jgi:SAM-dependent methyltransferase